MAAREVLELVTEDELEDHDHDAIDGPVVVSVVMTKPDDGDLRIVLVGDDCYSDQELLSTAENLKVAEVLTSEDGLDFVQSASECETLFVLSAFEGDIYHKLHRAEARIIGPPVVLACKQNKQVLPYSSRPLFCMSMQRIVVCFTGFKGRDRIGHLVDLVHHMGGSVRRDMTPKVTHLIANCTGGEKYKYAMTMGMPIMSGQWVEQLWEQRYNLDIMADSEAMMDYKVKPFFDCCLSFLGFSDAEKKHMEELTVQNGGVHTAVGSSEVTHLVVDEVSVKELPVGLALPGLIVRGEWFWGCIQMAACAEEKLYLFQEPSNGPERSSSSASLRPRSRKRKRLKQLAVEGELGSPYGIKRRSGETSAISLSPNSFLDASRTPDKSEISQSSVENAENKPVVPTSKASKRQHVVAELLQTETNYTGILHTILHTFKEQIEKDQYSGPLLAVQDTKIIFGNIPPIYDVHSKMKEDLTHLLENWTEEASVGAVILKHSDAFMKAYPNFVNFFMNTKETIIKCDQNNPRFHAFLKVCLSKPECGRQTLQELLIRPVQRLPSIILLLGDILKNTPNTHSDKENLERAIQSLKNVLTHINEDKRKTEGQMVMFDIVNDIDNCPANLLSSHRCFVNRIDVVELSDTAARRGDPLTLFVFNDSIEVCKRRTKASATPKTLTPHKAPQKTFKHLEMLPVSSIKRVLDFAETEDCMCAFGLIYRTKEQSNEKLLSFMLDSADTRKEEMLTSLCRNIANALCRTDFESVMAEVCGDEFHVNTKDLVRRTLTSKISKRVSRAFSINRTPGKLKRAVSHVFSPFMRDPQGGDLTHSRRLGASTFDLTEESPSGMSHFEDSDCISLGAYSLQEESSPVHFMTPKSTKTPKSKTSKWATIGPQSASKYYK
ncbi:protein ECT2-like [Littorina saxatilis]|uniref:protein ECT2-like n=1 Tax=Littorina saxatilis TaxID=31220 RepID=UPI0038B6807A